ncbi:MAG: flagellar biosynthetic protein FliR [Loktanella sp.]|nr:flagellar biosynthetic protein FliR [Loktanella sp.]
MIGQVPTLDDILGLGGLELQLLIDFMLVFFLHTLRLSAFFLSAPFFGAAAIPVQARVIASVVIAFGFYGLIEVPDPQNLPFLSMVEVALIEVAIGLSLGLAFTIVFSAVALTGEKIAASAGLGFAAQMDPNSGGQTPVISQFLNLFAIAAFLSLDGHLHMIALIRMSYEVLPLGQPFQFSVFVSAGLTAAGHMFTIASQLMLPVVSILLLANITVGVVTRSAPQLNLFSFGFPLTILTCFVALYVSTTPFASGISELIEFILEFIEDTIGEAGRG